MQNLTMLQTNDEFIRSFAGRRTKIHKGFLEYLLHNKGTHREISKYQDIVDILKEMRSKTDGDGYAPYKDYKVVITGHSLGGALAQLQGFAMIGNKVDLPLPLVIITYASPGVGNAAYVKKFKWFEKINAIRHIRITVQGDLFPSYPFVLSPQCGVNINLRKHQKAKIKYSENYNYVSRSAKATVNAVIKHTKTVQKHSVTRHVDLLKLDVNKEIVSSTVEQLYLLSGAFGRSKMMKYRASLVTSNESLQGTSITCCCLPKSSAFSEEKVNLKQAGDEVDLNNTKI